MLSLQQLKFMREQEVSEEYFESLEDFERYNKREVKLKPPSILSKNKVKAKYN